MNSILGELITKNYSNLTKGQKKVATYILRNPEEVAFLTSKKLGKNAGVSEATVIRLADALGISGFSEIQNILQSWLKRKLAPSEKLESTRIGRRTDIYEEIFENSVREILKAREGIPPSQFEEVVDALDRARRVFVVGLRRSHSIAFLLYYNLSRIRDGITLVDPAYGLRYDKILEIGDPDVFVAISFFRYARETMEITKFAREKEAHIVAITDNPVSPVGQLADISLCTGYWSPFFFGSHASTLVIVECIVGGLSLKRKRRYVHSLKKIEDTLRHCGVWLE
jgi:DNA-binding MurR/RpiR family transcriptional regulator